MVGRLAMEDDPLVHDCRRVAGIFVGDGRDPSARQEFRSRKFAVFGSTVEQELSEWVAVGVSREACACSTGLVGVVACGGMGGAFTAAATAGFGVSHDMVDAGRAAVLYAR